MAEPIKRSQPVRGAPRVYEVFTRTNYESESCEFVTAQLFVRSDPGLFGLTITYEGTSIAKNLRLRGGHHPLREDTSRIPFYTGTYDLISERMSFGTIDHMDVSIQLSTPHEVFR